MNEFVWVIVAIISGIISPVIVLIVHDRMSEKKWQRNFKFEKWKASKVRTDKKLVHQLQNPEPKNPLGEAGKWLKILRGLDPDQVSELADVILGGGEFTESESSGWLSDIIDQVPPEVITNFIQGMKEGKKPGGKSGFTSQID